MCYLHSNRLTLLLYKTPVFLIKTIFKQFPQIFGEYTLVEVCWATFVDIIMSVIDPVVLVYL